MTGGGAEKAKRLSAERFGSLADEYVRSEAHATGRDLELLVEMAAPSLEDEVLDIATGGGHTALALSPHVGRVVASDLAPEMLSAAAQHVRSAGAGNVEFALADAEDLPFDDHSFSLVTCRIAAHHFPHPDVFVNEVARVVAERGRFVLEDQEAPADPMTAAWLNHFERHRDPSHRRSLSADAWRTLMERSGMEVARIEHVEKEQLLTGWVARQGGGDGLLASLREMVANATDGARAWYRFEERDGDIAFVIPQVLLAASKSV